MHAEARYFIAEQLVQLSGYRHVVEVGGRNINGGVRDLVMLRPGVESYLSIDLEPGPGVDVVADAVTWAPPGLVDLVVCCEVLEHAVDPKAVVDAAVSWLRPGGTLLLTCATEPRAPHSGHDGAQVRDGEHYRNVPLSELSSWLEAGTDAQCEMFPLRGDLYAVAVKDA